jgi:hypothetical protein
MIFRLAKMLPHSNEFARPWVAVSLARNRRFMGRGGDFGINDNDMGFMFGGCQLNSIVDRQSRNISENPP